MKYLLVFTLVLTITSAYPSYQKISWNKTEHQNQRYWGQQRIRVYNFFEQDKNYVITRLEESEQQYRVKIMKGLQNNYTGYLEIDYRYSSIQSLVLKKNLAADNILLQFKNANATLYLIEKIGHQRQNILHRVNSIKTTINLHYSFSWFFTLKSNGFSICVEIEPTKASSSWVHYQGWFGCLFVMVMYFVTLNQAKSSYTNKVANQFLQIFGISFTIKLLFIFWEQYVILSKYSREYEWALIMCVSLGLLLMIQIFAGLDNQPEKKSWTLLFFLLMFCYSLDSYSMAIYLLYQLSSATFDKEIQKRRNNIRFGNLIYLHLLNMLCLILLREFQINCISQNVYEYTKLSNTQPLASNSMLFIYFMIAVLDSLQGCYLYYFIQARKKVRRALRVFFAQMTLKLSDTVTKENEKKGKKQTSEQRKDK